MDNLEKTLIALFRHVPVRKIVADETFSTKISCDDYVRIMRADQNKYSETELKNLYYYLTGKYMEELYGAEYKKAGEKGLDVFELLRSYAERILTEQDNEIVCRYPRFLHWRKITEALSEDLFTTCFVASRKRENASERVRLDWKAVITHNNWELHKILEQGMAENHAHLKGTAPVFQLTWISLMNNPGLYDEYSGTTKIGQNRRNISPNLFTDYQEADMSVQLIQAAGIRYYLFCLLCSTAWRRKKTEELRGYLDKLNDSNDIYELKRYLSVELAVEKNSWSRKTLPDYALAGVIRENGDTNDRTKIFQGERWILYRIFSEIFSGKQWYGCWKLFYGYLVIKENFRAEFVQNNREVGFRNFQIYENRKDMFLENSFFQNELVKKAIEANFAESKAAVIEMRIAPKKSAESYYNYIQNVDRLLSVQKRYRNRLFYVVHFIKLSDTVSDYEFLECRHSKNRSKYREEALQLVRFRESYPKEAKRIRGIDAANMEIGCGAEVFAQVFRYLTDHVVFFEASPERKIPQLRKTYHVGEDFLDLASGLRAIDEAIQFLGMRCGDRLGHAIALGIDVDEWYRDKNNRILLTQQEYLDNVAWMYHFVMSCHLNDQENILSYLQKEYEYYFRIVYKNAMDQRMLDDIGQKAMEHYQGTEWEKYYRHGNYDFSIENYYSAWELRGDAPELYRKGYYDNKSIIGYRYRSFAYYSIDRDFPRKQNKRYFQEVALLYYYYHFNGNVRKEGEKTIEKKIDRAYIHCVRMLQHELQKLIAKRGIGIETNLSSNKQISTFRRYDKHPILSFYNKGLAETEEKRHKCQQLSVSINTDDAGIFGTSLENEYAYMALALEKMKDEQGNPLYKRRNIYEWLDHIRIMGLRQTFLDEEEMKKAMREWMDDRKEGEVPKHDLFNHSTGVGLFYADSGCCSDCRIFKGKSC